MSANHEKTLSILTEIRGGNRAAVDDLLAHVYDDLRELAAVHMRREHGHTLQPTALVHEVYVRLVDQTRANWKDRSHFFAVASQAMRRILIDHFRRHQAAKRGGGRQRITLAGIEAARKEIDFLDLDEAIDQLAALDARQARIVEMRYLGGLTVDEVAIALGVSKSLVEKEWRMARAWLLSFLKEIPDH